MSPNSFWITGPVRSGKTTRLVQQFKSWVETADSPAERSPSLTQKFSTKAQLQQRAHAIIVLAANAGNRVDLANQIVSVTQGRCTVNSTTPLGFFEDEVILFWPLLLQQLNLKAMFPLRLRPENEQELAMSFWQADLRSVLPVQGLSLAQQVRQCLDLLQLAAFSATPLEAVSETLQVGFAEQQLTLVDWAALGQLLVGWRDWCLARGLMTYGIISELYWRYLLPHPAYQQHLKQRFQAVLADDVDNYPAIAGQLLEVLLDQGAAGAFTYNPDGAIRLGLGADPQFLARLSHRCQIESLTEPVTPVLRPLIEPMIDEVLTLPSQTLPQEIQSIQANSRAELLRKAAETIIAAVNSGEVLPQEIAVIAPGLDAIARYTLTEILARQNILVESLNDQQPLNSSPIVRALLSLLALIYPGVGRWIEREQIAEMLVMLTLKRRPLEGHATPLAKIDPVRAGLLADHCFQPHPEQPKLLPHQAFPRWDRLSHEATAAYGEILQWLEQQRSGLTQASRQQYLTLSPVFVLDRAIQQFLVPHNLSHDQLATLRELIETAQHYWEVEARLRQSDTPNSPSHHSIANFIQLLRSGTITANPLPVKVPGQTSRAVMLATTFQYRSARQSHRWHFWLDASSSRWQGGGAVVLWGAPLFLQSWSGQALTLTDDLNRDQDQLRRLLLDLLSRVSERVYLCHSDLSISGQEQVGPLLPFVDAAIPFATASDSTSMT